jgi:hypothetical protein
MLRKTCPKFSVVQPSISVQVRTNCMDFSHPEKTCPATSSISVLEMDVREPWKACQHSQKILLLFSSKSVHINGSTALQICIVRTVLYFYLLPRNPCLLFALGCVPLPLQMLSLFSKLNLSLLFLLSQQKCMNNPRMGAPLYPNRPHEVGEEFSNPMVEIRLDVWLRFDVSSFTLTKVIKSPFNLHLTN